MSQTSILNRAAGRLLHKVAPIAALLALLPGPQPVLAQSEPAVIEGLSVSDAPGSAVLTVRISREVDWTALWLSTSVLWLTLRDCVVTDKVSDLQPDRALISAVNVLGSAEKGPRPPEDSAPIVLLEVFLRSPASYSTVVQDDRLVLTFISREEPPPPAPVPQPETPAVATRDPKPEASQMPPPDDAAQPLPAAPSSTDLPAAPSSTDLPAASASEISGEYRIGPGDLLEVSVFGLDDFDRGVRVLRDGSISLPLVGGLRVAGLTLEEAESAVADLLLSNELVNEPHVSFFVKDYVSRGVSVQGAVERPGVYQMIQQRTLLEILGEAGGISGRESDRAGRQIFVIRQTADGGQRRIEIDGEQLVNEGRAELNIALLPGDVVLVPFTQTYRVYVSGAVVRPGPVEYLSSEGITALQAITAAGGPTERGNLGNVTIVRQLADGSESRTAVNVKRIRKGKQQDVQLERSDTVIVGEWFF